ncbi:sugar phosphate isomerase/epimerase IoIE [Thermus sp. LT1-2-5]|uniref:TIM barrel protein n=1 Tax=Thermus sp. LT1-2-5 TaxID=3026935 RepID=UPI0030E986F3
MRLATSPINWNNEDVPEYRPWVPYPQILDEIRVAGYRATEWSRSLAEDPDTLRRDLEARDLEVVGAFVALELKDPYRWEEAWEKALRLARFLQGVGASYLVAADPGDEGRRRLAGAVPRGQEIPPEALRHLARGLEELGRRLGDLGLALVFHPHAGTYVETEGEVYGLLENTAPEWVGLCLDTGHLVYGGTDPVELLRRHGNRVGYVHLKDVDPAVLRETRGKGFREALRRYIFCPLGEGVARVSEVVALLRGLGYAGPVVVEQDTTPEDPTAVARRNRAYVEKLLQQHGGP